MPHLALSTHDLHEDARPVSHQIQLWWCSKRWEKAAAAAAAGAKQQSSGGWLSLYILELVRRLRAGVKANRLSITISSPAAFEVKAKPLTNYY